MARGLGGKIALVGTTALGTREVVATPLDTLFVGVEVQATVADNLLQGDFIRRPQDQGALEAGVTLLAGTVAALLIARGVMLGAALATGGLAAVWFAAVWLLASHGVFVSVLFPTLGWTASFASGQSGQLRLRAQARRHRRRPNHRGPDADDPGDALADGSARRRNRPAFAAARSATPGCWRRSCRGTRVFGTT